MTTITLLGKGNTPYHHATWNKVYSTMMKVILGRYDRSVIMKLIVNDIDI